MSTDDLPEDLAELDCMEFVTVLVQTDGELVIDSNIDDDDREAGVLMRAAMLLASGDYCFEGDEEDDD